MNFEQNNYVHGYIHGIIHDSVTTFDKKLDAPMTNSSSRRSFQLFVRFYVWSTCQIFFCEASAKILENMTPLFFTQQDYI